MRLFPFALSLSALPFLLLGAATAGEPAALVAGNPNQPLTTALDSIHTDNLKADLYFLASDEMQGRDTPSPEQRIAARYIAARLERLGWTPGAQDGWFWDYSLPTVAIDSSKSGLSATRAGQRLDLKFGTDYAFHPGSIADVDVSGKGIVFAGTLSEDDVEGLDLEGCWALCTSSEEKYMKVASNARKAGAVGVIVLPGPGLEDEEMIARVQSWGKEATEGRLSRGRGNSRSRSYLYMTGAGARKLYEFAGVASPVRGTRMDVELSEVRAVAAESQAGLENVVGIWPGSDPKLKQELIILSAHYDHVGANDDGTVFNGADDNGSGTVGLLSVAEALSNYGPMRRSVMLMWVSGEEKGLLGSKAWTENPYLPDGLRPVANINTDMIGRNDPRSLLITPTSDHDAYNGLTRMAEKLCALEGFDQLGSADAYWNRSDHANFSKNLEIPVAFLFADVHEDYHKVTDTPDKIDYDKIRRVARLVVRILDGLQTDVLEL